jgi:hypothetical protein
LTGNKYISTIWYTLKFNIYFQMSIESNKTIKNELMKKTKLLIKEWKRLLEAEENKKIDKELQENLETI